MSTQESETVEAMAMVCLVPSKRYPHFAGVEVQLYGGHEPRIGDEFYSAATVAELRAEVERLRTDAYKFRRLARLLDGFDFRLGRNVLMPPATYLDSVEIACEFQPGVGQSVIDAIIDTLTGADPVG